MATIPTPEESAKRILELFLEFHCRPGHVLGQNNLFGAFMKSPWQVSDIVPGLKYAAEQGWIEILDKNKFRLTELGFSKAGEEDDMDLFSQCNESVTVERAADSSRHENVQARVTKDLIIIPDSSLPLSADDVILRQLPSGLVERLVVTDPGFRAEFHAIPAHYQVHYRLEGKEREGRPGYVVHVSGENARVNIHSTDYSTNIVNYREQDLAQLAEELQTLREELVKRARGPEDYAIIGRVSEAELAAKARESSTLGKVLSTLGAGGRWVLDVVKEIGVQLVVETIKPYLGLPPG